MTFVIYVGASSGLAVTHSYGLLIGLRCIQAAGSASVIAIGAGSIGDIAPPSERGGYMSFFSLGAMYVTFLVSRISFLDPHSFLMLCTTGWDLQQDLLLVDFWRKHMAGKRRSRFLPYSGRSS